MMFSQKKRQGFSLSIDSITCYSEHFVKLSAREDHLIVIGSNGLTDIENKIKEHFDRSRSHQLIKTIATLSTDNILKEISSEINRFASKKRPEDDVIVVIAKIR